MLRTTRYGPVVTALVEASEEKRARNGEVMSKLLYLLRDLLAATTGVDADLRHTHWPGCPSDRHAHVRVVGHLVLPVIEVPHDLGEELDEVGLQGPGDVNWPSHRIASTNQHPTHMGTQCSMPPRRVRGSRGLRKPRHMAKINVEVSVLVLEVLQQRFHVCQGARATAGEHERVSHPVRRSFDGVSALQEHGSGAKASASRLEMRVPSEQRIEALTELGLTERRAGVLAVASPLHLERPVLQVLRPGQENALDERPNELLIPRLVARGVDA